MEAQNCHKNYTAWKKTKLVLIILMTSTWYSAYCENGLSVYGTTIQSEYIKASNTGGSDLFGRSVALDGNTLVVGASSEKSNATGINGNQFNNSSNNSGAVYVYVNIAGVWSQQAYIKASNTDPGDKFGSSVAISGDTLVVGAPLEQSNATTINGDDTDNSLDGSGAAYVFVRIAGVWQQQAYLKGSNSVANQGFGKQVAIVNDTIAVGAFAENNIAIRSGAVYVFERDLEIWDQQAYLKAPNIDAEDKFGTSVALTETTLIVGAPFEGSNSTGINGNQNNNNSSFAGAAYIFERVSNNWEFQTYIKASNTDAQDNFGSSVAIYNNMVVIGATFEDSSSTGVNGIQSDNSSAAAGAAYVFTQNLGIWTQQAYLKASNTDAGDYFGVKVTIDDNIIAIGARWEQSNTTGIDGNEMDNTVNGSGAVYTFEKFNNQWLPQSYIKQSNTAQVSTGDWFGRSLALSQNKLVVGAPWEDSAALGIGGDESDNTLTQSGAAYLYAITIELMFLNGFE